MSESFNPFVFTQSGDSDYNSGHHADALESALLNAHKENKPLSANEIMALQQQVQDWKQRADELEESVLALADIMYQQLAFINAIRLYQQKDPIMVHNVDAIIDTNLVLSEITNDLRKASIDSGLGLITELQASQEYLRTQVMETWRERFNDPKEREELGRLLLDKKPDATTEADATGHETDDGETLDSENDEGLF